MKSLNVACQPRLFLSWRPVAIGFGSASFRAGSPWSCARWSSVSAPGVGTWESASLVLPASSCLVTEMSESFLLQEGPELGEDIRMPLRLDIKKKLSARRQSRDLAIARRDGFELLTALAVFGVHVFLLVFFWPLHRGGETA